jgi:hypothetical protein
MVGLDAELPCVVRYVETADGGTDTIFDYVPTQPRNSSQWQYRCGIRSRGSDAAVLGGGEAPVLLFPFATVLCRGVGGGTATCENARLDYTHESFEL